MKESKLYPKTRTATFSKYLEEKYSPVLERLTINYIINRYK